MEKIDIKSYGKVNLALDVLYKRDDGYHEIDTIMQEISLHDKLTFENIGEDKIIIESDKEEVPLDSRNLVYKAWEKIRDFTGVKRGIRIRIQKNIPIAAGLAGGSSNAAATLRALDQLWALDLSEGDLQDLGLSIGADVPFCLLGGTKRARGVGEELVDIKAFKDKHILLFNPGVHVSTEYVYENLNLGNSPRIDMERIQSFIEEEDTLSLGKNMKNIMEDLVIKKHPLIGWAKEVMINGGALGSLMSGSGPTVFGIFQDEDLLKTCKNTLEKKGITIACKTI